MKDALLYRGPRPSRTRLRYANDVLGSAHMYIYASTQPGAPCEVWLDRISEGAERDAWRLAYAKRLFGAVMALKRIPVSDDTRADTAERIRTEAARAAKAAMALAAKAAKRPARKGGAK